MSRRAVDFPVPSPQAYRFTWPKDSVTAKLWTKLACSGVAQSDRVPLPYMRSQSGWYQSARVWKVGLKKSVPPTVITMEMSIQDQVQGFRPQGGLYES